MVQNVKKNWDYPENKQIIKLSKILNSGQIKNLEIL